MNAVVERWFRMGGTFPVPGMDMPLYGERLWKRRHEFDFVLPNEKFNNVRYRHIRSLDKKELMQIKWNGETNMSYSQRGSGSRMFKVAILTLRLNTSQYKCAVLIKSSF